MVTEVADILGSVPGNWLGGASGGRLGPRGISSAESDGRRSSDWYEEGWTDEVDVDGGVLDS